MDNQSQEVLADSTSSSDLCSSLDQLSTRCASNRLEEPVSLKTDIRSLITVPPRPSSFGPDKLCSDRLRNRLLQNFQTAFLLANDGNSFYRLVAIQHIIYMSRSKEAREEFARILCQEHFELTLLQNVPQSFELMDNKEILYIIEGLAGEFAHCSCAEFAERMVNTLSKQPEIDFAVVAAYRLYTYFVGYRHIESELSMLLEGNEELAILSYGDEVAPIIIKIIAQSLSARIAIYTMIDDEIELTSFGLEFSEFHKFELSVMLVNNRFSLLVEKDRGERQIDKGKYCIKPVRLEKLCVQINKNQEKVKVGELDDEFFQEIYQNMHETERKEIILEYIRANYSISQ